MRLRIYAVSKKGSTAGIQKVYEGSDKTSSLAVFNSFIAGGDFCRLQITFANGLDPDQDRHNVGPDLDPNRLTL